MSSQTNPNSSTENAPFAAKERPNLRKKIRTVSWIVVATVLAAHALVGVVSAVWVVARYFEKPKVQFTAEKRVDVKPEMREHRLPNDQTDSMRRQQTANNRIQSLKPTALTLPELPDVPQSPMIPVDANVAPSDAAQVGVVSNSSGTGNAGFFGEPGNPGNNLLAGTLYDLKLRGENQPSEFKDGATSRDNNLLYGKILTRLFAAGASESSLKPYYQLPKNLFAGQVDVPGMNAAAAPKAFSADIQPRYWVIVYRCMVSPPKDGTYRFAGSADDVLVVRFNNRIVLDGSLTPAHFTRWESKDKDSLRGVWGKNPPPASQVVYGDWIDMKASQKYPIQVVIGEMPGGFFYANLCIQEKGATYPAGPDGKPILPLFRTVAGQPAKGGVRPVAADGPIFKAATKGNSGP